MKTNKILTGVMIVIVSVMLLNGLYYPESPLMWLAATTTEYAYMRAALLGVLITLFITDPPLSKSFRLFLAAFSSVIFISTVGLVSAYTIGILDAVIFIELAIIFMIEAAENKTEQATHAFRIKPIAYK